MATCPRCGGPLEEFELGGHTQSSCADCGYVGVPVDHESDREKPESWTTAIERFNERHGDAAGPEVDRTPGDDLGPTERNDGADGRASEDATDSEPADDGSEPESRNDDPSAPNPDAGTDADSETAGDGDTTDDELDPSEDEADTGSTASAGDDRRRKKMRER